MKLRRAAQIGATIMTLAMVSLGASCGSGDGSGAPQLAAGIAATDSGVIHEIVTATAALQLLDEGAVLIDVRTPEEFAEQHVAGARLIDINGPDFEAELEALDPDAAYVVYCRTGNRSAAATARMVTLGFVEVYDAGGISDWVDAGAVMAADG